MLHGAKCQPPKLLSSGHILHTDIPDLTLDASDKNVGNKGTAASLASDFEGSGLWLSSAWQRSAVQCSGTGGCGCEFFQRLPTCLPQCLPHHELRALPEPHHHQSCAAWIQGWDKTQIRHLSCVQRPTKLRRLVHARAFHKLRCVMRLYR